MSADREKIINILEKLCEKIKEKKNYLTELDSAIGDGDLGINMCNGFQSAVQEIKAEKSDDIGTLLKKFGIGVASHAGGSLGSLYGAAFIKASEIVMGRTEVDIYDFEKMLKAALAGIKAIGKCKAGDKTMIDAIEPACETLGRSICEGMCPLDSLKSAVEAAYSGAESTRELIAKKGRASLYGSNTVGHIDPGAVLSAVILEVIYDELKQKD